VYEEYHRVVIDDAALQAAVTLSKNIRDRFLPDKAIDLIDEACAKVSIEAVSGHAMVLAVVDAASADARKRAEQELQELKPLLGTVEKLGKSFVNDPAIERVERTLANHIEEIESSIQMASTGDRPRVTKHNIETIIKEWIGNNT
jgi:ATP-dependent Clp protease ATP-binding subunit ClpC